MIESWLIPFEWRTHNINQTTLHTKIASFIVSCTLFHKCKSTGSVFKNLSLFKNILLSYHKQGKTRLSMYAYACVYAIWIPNKNKWLKFSFWSSFFIFHLNKIILTILIMIELWDDADTLFNDNLSHCLQIITLSFIRYFLPKVPPRFIGWRCNVLN